MNDNKKVFVCIVVLSGDICREGCKVVKMTAVSQDGKRFCYEPDGERYYADGSKMWGDFENFCHSCGIGKGRGEVWVASTPSACGTACQTCSSADCYNVFDDLDYLGDWNTKYLKNEYGYSNFMQEPQLGFDEFCKLFGYDVLSDAEDVRTMYEKYTTLIEKASYSEEECENLVDYLRTNVPAIFGAENKSELLDNKIYITRAILRLARSSKQKLWQAVDLLCAAAQSVGGNCEEAFYDFLEGFVCEYEEAFGIALKGDLPECILTPQNGEYLKALYSKMRKLSDYD